MEVGLGMACEEACRLILTSDEYGIFVSLGEIAGEDGEGDFDSLALRERVYDILSRRELSYGERLCLISEAFDVTPAALDDGEWKEVLSSLEYLEEAHRDRFSVYTSSACPSAEWEEPLERALAYFVYRHCSEAESEWDFRCSLGFCLFCERLLASMAENVCSWDDFSDCARILSEELEYSEENTEGINTEFFTLL
jgi:hypothetical protein